MKHHLLEDLYVEVKELSDTGEVMSVGQFVQNIIEGAFIDYDGFAHFIVTIDGKKHEITDLVYSIFFDTVSFKDEELCGLFDFVKSCNIHEVVWYNR